MSQIIKRIQISQNVSILWQGISIWSNRLNKLIKNGSYNWKKGFEAMQNLNYLFNEEDIIKISKSHIFDVGNKVFVDKKRGLGFIIFPFSEVQMNSIYFHGWLRIWIQSKWEFSSRLNFYCRSFRVSFPFAQHWF